MDSYGSNSDQWRVLVNAVTEHRGSVFGDEYRYKLHAVICILSLAPPQVLFSTLFTNGRNYDWKYIKEMHSSLENVCNFLKRNSDCNEIHT